MIIFLSVQLFNKKILSLSHMFVLIEHTKKKQTEKSLKRCLLLCKKDNLAMIVCN